MALTWDLREVTDFEAGEETTWAQGPGRYTEVLIWYAMFTGIGWQITDENVEEFIARIRVMEAFGEGILAPKDTATVPEDAIRAHRGMKVNVAPEPRAAWLLRKFAQAFPKAVEHDTKCPECGGQDLRWRMEQEPGEGPDLVQVCRSCDHEVTRKPYYGEALVMVG